MIGSNASNSRLNRIERLIEQAERANREARARHEKAHARHEQANAHHQQAHARHDREMRQLGDDLRRWAAFAEKDDRSFRKGLAELKALQRVTAKMLQQFISSHRSRNGHS